MSAAKASWFPRIARSTSSTLIAPLGPGLWPASTMRTPA
jgi:hypothetical protein